MIHCRAVASIEEAEGHQHLAGGHGGGCEQMFPLPPRGIGVATPGFFFVYFKYKILHFDAFFGSENGHYQCFYQDPYALGEVKTVGRGCRMRTDWPKIEAEGRERGGVLGSGQQAPPARGSGSSNVNKTKFLTPRPRSLFSPK